MRYSEEYIFHVFDKLCYGHGMSIVPAFLQFLCGKKLAEFDDINDGLQKKENVIGRFSQDIQNTLQILQLEDIKELQDYYEGIKSFQTEGMIRGHDLKSHFHKQLLLLTDDMSWEDALSVFINVVTLKKGALPIPEEIKKICEEIIAESEKQLNERQSIQIKLLEEANAKR